MSRPLPALACLLVLVACNDDHDAAKDMQAAAFAEQSRKQMEALTEQSGRLHAVLEQQMRRLDQADAERRQTQERMLGMERVIGASGHAGSDLGPLAATVIVLLGAFGMGTVAALYVWEMRRRDRHRPWTAPAYPADTVYPEVVETVVCEPGRTSTSKLRERPKKVVSPTSPRRALPGGRTVER